MHESDPRLTPQLTYENMRDMGCGPHVRCTHAGYSYDLPYPSTLVSLCGEGGWSFTQRGENMAKLANPVITTIVASGYDAPNLMF